MATNTRSQLAAALAALYAVLVIGGVVVRLIWTGDWGTFHYSLGLPATWLAAAVASLAAWGLLNRRRWAWWVAVLGAVIQLVRIASNYFAMLNHIQPPLTMVFVAGTLLALISVLLMPGGRSSFQR